MNVASVNIDSNSVSCASVPLRAESLFVDTSVVAMLLSFSGSATLRTQDVEILSLQLGSWCMDGHEQRTDDAQSLRSLGQANLLEESHRHWHSEFSQEHAAKLCKKSRAPAQTP